MLKIIGLYVELAPKADVKEVVNDSGRADKTIVYSTSQNSIYVPNIGIMGKPNFLTPDIKKAFNHLRQAFIEAPIL